MLPPPRLLTRVRPIWKINHQRMIFWALEMNGIAPIVGIVLSIVSLAISVIVAWLTLLRRGTLRMTQPVQIAFVYENGTKPKIFLRTLLYATGKRGYIIEGLYLKVKQPDSIQTYGFRGYG